MEKNFASDNNAPVHPLIMKALEEANKGYSLAYGDDNYTAEAVEKFKSLFGKDIEVFFVFNGTGANVLGIGSMMRSFHAVICTEVAHINVDECGAPERYLGSKLITVTSNKGKLSISDVEKHLGALGVQHHSQPKVISITQSTEYGTVYSLEEIKEIADFAHKNGMYLHMDGARISNAVVSLNTTLKAMTADVGVDVLSYGGTKNGMMFGEAVVFFNTEFAKDFMYLRKNGLQLASKMRYIAAQFNALLTDDLWKKNAQNANEMAKLLAEKASDIQGIKITCRVDANEVFAVLPRAAIQKAQEKCFFYDWDESKNEVRWVTAFDTTIKDIDDFVNILKEAVG